MRKLLVGLKIGKKKVLVLSEKEYELRIRYHEIQPHCSKM